MGEDEFGVGFVELGRNGVIDRNDPQSLVVRFVLDEIRPVVADDGFLLFIDLVEIPLGDEGPNRRGHAPGDEIVIENPDHLLVNDGIHLLPNTKKRAMTPASLVCFRWQRLL